MKKIIGVLILLGALGFAASITQKAIYWPNVLDLIPTSYIKFSAICLLLAIALSVRQLAFKEK
jgi:hypothetical protein